MVSKVHHCMVDGVAGSDLLGVIMDLEPDAPPLEPDPWIPAPEPSRIDLARYTAEMAIATVWTFVRDTARRVVASLANVAPARRDRRRARPHGVAGAPGRVVPDWSDRAEPAVGPHSRVARRRQDDSQCVRRHRQ